MAQICVAFSEKLNFNTLAQLQADRNGQFTKYKKGARWAKIWLIIFSLPKIEIQGSSDL